MQDLLEFNPWWKNVAIAIKEDNWPKRFIFNQIFSLLDKEFIISISGLRRLGKTTILKQLIAQKLKEGFDSKKILFYQFSQSQIDLAGVLNYYFNTILNVNLYGIECYIFLDELQYIIGWQEILKHYYDLNPKLHFIITGSTSLFIKQGNQESLAGRILDFTINPLSFAEYLFLTKQTNLSIPAIDFFSPDLFEQLKIKQSILALYQNKFFDYLIFGEFPQLILEEDFFLIKKYLDESLLDKFFNQDIQLFEIHKLREIRTLYKVLMQNSAQFVNKSNIAREIGLSYPLMDKYLEILKKAFLVNYSDNFLRGARAQAKSFKKVYSTSLNLLAIILNINDYRQLLFPDFLGHVIENYVFNVLRPVYRDQLCFFFKNKKEVDLVINLDNKILPIEVKTKKELGGNDFRHLLFFMQEKNLKKGIIVYGGELDKKYFLEQEILLIPYWLI